MWPGVEGHEEGGNQQRLGQVSIVPLGEGSSESGAMVMGHSSSCVGDAVTKDGSPTAASKIVNLKNLKENM